MRILFAAYQPPTGKHPMKTAHDLVAAAKARVQEVPLTDAEQAILAADVLVDVREADEFTAGHVPGAVHISRGLLEFKFSANPALQARDLNILLYCKTSGRAALAAAVLQDMGYLNVRSVAGGFDAWAAAGKPVAKPEAPSFE
jgi:rhodanese-related sulfurtransferase